MIVSESYSQKDSSIIVHDIDSSLTDTLRIKKHSPKLATYMSVVLPGLGQAYNKKYWKIPIIYAGFGTLIYLYKQNNDNLTLADTAYNQLMRDPTIEYLDVNGYVITTTDDAKLMKDEYRKSRDFNAILIVMLYVLNIVDASVDAHFYNFDISDDLSIRIEPTMINTISTNKTFGVKLNVYF